MWSARRDPELRDFIYLHETLQSFGGLVSKSETRLPSTQSCIMTMRCAFVFPSLYFAKTSSVGKLDEGVRLCGNKLILSVMKPHRQLVNKAANPLNVIKSRY